MNNYKESKKSKNLEKADKLLIKATRIIRISNTQNRYLISNQNFFIKTQLIISQVELVNKPC
ncbi:hypothetical protein BpHYR1_004944 [Brachionus plicatilis]|uniref:Uncharacterized protein n=1 Tax=Brachionus plicatilis TaxID=10195 RepID=A0A3M7S1F9_BRAPC|nr:hypothetical protein BpHYR1_004944 [Brachionus plicatilis]